MREKNEPNKLGVYFVFFIYGWLPMDFITYSLQSAQGIFGDGDYGVFFYVQAIISCVMAIGCVWGMASKKYVGFTFLYLYFASSIIFAFFSTFFNENLPLHLTRLVFWIVFSACNMIYFRKQKEKMYHIYSQTEVTEL